MSRPEPSRFTDDPAEGGGGAPHGSPDFSVLEKKVGDQAWAGGDCNKAVQAWEWALMHAWIGECANDVRIRLHLNLAHGLTQIGEPGGALEHCMMLMQGELAPEVTEHQQKKAVYRRLKAEEALLGRCNPHGSGESVVGVPSGR